MKDKILFTSTVATAPQPDLTLQKISEAMKAIFAVKDAREEQKMLGLQAMNLKFNQPENYRKLDDEDKALIDNAIETRACIMREETANELMSRIV